MSSFDNMHGGREKDLQLPVLSTFAYTPFPQRLRPGRTLSTKVVLRRWRAQTYQTGHRQAACPRIASCVPALSHESCLCSRFAQ